MMLAVLSDIHANHIALEAVLNEVRSLNIQKLLLLGDYVGYFYRPASVFEMLTAWDKVMVKGNHENFLELTAEERMPLIEKYGHGLEKTFEQLTKHQLTTLTDLPSTLRVEIDGISFLLCHGSPQSTDEYVYPDANSEILNRCAQGADFVLMGHTHHPFIYRNPNNQTILCNPGSVGQPRDYAEASWATINTTDKSVEIRRTTFDISACLEEIDNFDPNHNGLKQVMMRKNAK